MRNMKYHSFEQLTKLHKFQSGKDFNRYLRYSFLEVGSEMGCLCKLCRERVLSGKLVRQQGKLRTGQSKDSFCVFLWKDLEEEITWS